jgi:hypothetical protein
MMRRRQQSAARRERALRILSHRGYWKEAAEKNTPTAFRRSFDLGFGTETDVRDANGVLVISHDMPQGGETTLDEFIAFYAESNLPLAINIKADGMADALTQKFAQANIANWFAFDMAVPDMRGYLRAGAPTFARMSEVERDPPWLDQAAGVWLDAFETQWWDAEALEALLAQKRVCVVSPELHRRDPDSVWRMLKPFGANDALMLCTDRPEEARDFFGEKQ